MSKTATAGIAIVAPGGYAPDDAGVARAIVRLEQAGCRVFNYYDPAEKHQRFGAIDERRVAQLHEAVRNSEVDIVLALRGGYGMSRILPQIDLALLANSGKRFVGHSDFTALQMALLATHGTMSFAGPMICDDFAREEASDFTLQHFWQCLRHPSHAIGFASDDNPDVDVSGTLWGGNLTMLTHMLGSPWFPHVDGGILFIEDINEHPYRVERMMLQLLHAGALNQKAIVLGDFSAYRLSDYDNGYDFDSMLAWLRQRIGVPVLRGLPFGHIRDKVTLAVGCDAHVKSTQGGAVLTMSGYPALTR
jgi:muramoyltetrapeptide carboxypeptidase